MKMIINGFISQNYHPVILGILKNFKVDCCHIIQNDFSNNTLLGIELIFYDIKKIPLGDYNVDWNKIKPLDEELIDLMSGCETVALKMMDRHLHIPLYKDRKRIYLKHLRYWNHIITENKFDLFLSSAPPHEVYDYILYNLCKLKKIPTVSLFQIMYSDVAIIMDDWQNINLKIKGEYHRLLNSLKSVSEKEIDLFGGLKNDFDRFMLTKNPTPHYMTKKATFFNKRLLEKIFSCREINCLFFKKGLSVFIDKLVYAIKIKISKTSLFGFYNKNTIEPDMKKKFIYFPLHMQPEATTSPLAGAFVDQILIAQMIASFLPKNIYLYIKEHPSQTNFGRDIEFYKELLEIPQVRLVPMSYDTFSLINNSMAVATGTGTVGWEALHREKPVLLFGHCYYQYAKGVFMIRRNEDCRKALEKIIKENFKPRIKDLKIYMKVLENYTIECYVDPAFREVSSITDKINNKNILNELTSKIKAVCNIL
jgi:hypothetical protein